MRDTHIADNRQGSLAVATHPSGRTGHLLKRFSQMGAMRMAAGRKYRLLAQPGARFRPRQALFASKRLFPARAGQSSVRLVFASPAHVGALPIYPASPRRLHFWRTRLYSPVFTGHR